MNKEVTLVIAEDDNGHSILIERNLRRAGLGNPIIKFTNGRDTLDFFIAEEGHEPRRISGESYLLLLDLRMPRISGVDVLRTLKEKPELNKIPVIVITTTDDPREIEECHALGCSTYIKKPVEYDDFVEVIRQLGLFLMLVEVPKINGEYDDGSTQTG